MLYVLQALLLIATDRQAAALERLSPTAGYAGSVWSPVVADAIRTGLVQASRQQYFIKNIQAGTTLVPVVPVPN